MSSVIDRQDMDQNHQDPGQINVRHKFTPDELRALRECNRESFYYRCLPIGSALTIATYFAVKNGYLKGSPRWGASPKMFAASIVGYFIGKFSYQSACIDKIMQVPNSQLAEQLRQRRGLPPREMWGAGIGGEGAADKPSLSSSMPSGPESASDYPPQNVFTDVGDTRPLDSFDSDPLSRDRSELVMEEDIPLQPATKTTTYEELRRANRDEFLRGRSSAPVPPPTTRPPARDERTSGLGTGAGIPGGSGGQKVVKNKYGDEWEKTD